jgi:hypothetical protein
MRTELNDLVASCHLVSLVVLELGFEKANSPFSFL